MNEPLTLKTTELQQLLEEAAERGAARAIQQARQSLKKKWLCKEDAMELLDCSYHTLNRLVNTGVIRKNSDAKHGRKFYSRADIERYMSAKD